MPAGHGRVSDLEHVGVVAADGDPFLAQLMDQRRQLFGYDDQFGHGSMKQSPSANVNRGDSEAAGVVRTLLALMDFNI